MPFPFNLRRFLPLRNPEEDLRTPEFNPSSMGGKRPLPMPARSLPTVQSEQPQLPPSRPSAPILPTGGQLPASMSAQPDPANQTYTRVPQLPQPSRAPIPLSDQRPSTALTRPQVRPMPNIPQLPGRVGPMRPDNPVDRAEFDYVMQGAKRNPDGTLAGNNVQFGRSGKQIALGALEGLRTGGLIGAAAGALTNVIDPMTGRERNFQALHLPRIQEQQARQQQEQQRQQQQAMQDLAMQRGQVGLEQEQAQTALYKAQADKALNPAIPRRNVRLTPMQLPDGSVILVDTENPENEGREFKPFVRPQTMSPTQQRAESEIEREAEEGTPEEIADSSYQARGGDNYVFSKLPPKIQEVLRTGTVDGSPATPEEIEGADRLYQQAILRQRKADLDYTKGVARGKASTRATGRQARPTTGATPMRSGDGKKGTVGPRILAGVAAQKGISEDEAARMLEADGYTVRRQ